MNHKNYHKKSSRLLAATMLRLQKSSKLSPKIITTIINDSHLHRHKSSSFSLRVWCDNKTYKSVKSGLKIFCFEKSLKKLEKSYDQKLFWAPKIFRSYYRKCSEHQISLILIFRNVLNTKNLRPYYQKCSEHQKSLNLFIRNVLGTKNLGDILSERESIAHEMKVRRMILPIYRYRYKI